MYQRYHFIEDIIEKSMGPIPDWYRPQIYKSFALTAILLNSRSLLTVLVDTNEYHQSTSYLYRR